MNVLTDRSRRAGRRRLVVLFAVLALVPAALLVWVATTSAHTADRGDPPDVAVAPPASPGAHVATPLLSARRLPGTVTGQLATKDLVAGLDALASALPAPTCLTAAVDGAVVYDSNGSQPVLPASNMKLVVAAVALDKLGPDHTFTTSVVKGPDGTLYLVGGGDPVLSTQAYLDAAKAAADRASASGELEEAPSDVHTSFEQLAAAVAAADPGPIPAVVGDDSRYDQERFVPSWPASYAADLEAGPLGALMVNDAFATLHPKFTLAADPAEAAATELAAELHGAGVQVGPARSGPAPAGATPVASVASPPLSAILGEMLGTSDNNTAELLLKEIGKAAAGQGTRAAGLQVVQQTLTSWGVPLDGVTWVDGSGLDRGDRLTCHALLAVMDHVRIGPVAAALPVANQTGTLLPYFANNPVAGKLHGKTGTLTGAKALTGFLPAADGHTITFSFVYNGPNSRESAAGLWDRLGKALATYPYQPDLAAFSPAPPTGA